jgi:hypothetical protein
VQPLHIGAAGTTHVAVQLHPPTMQVTAAPSLTPRPRTMTLRFAHSKFEVTESILIASQSQQSLFKPIAHRAGRCARN